MVLHRRAGQGVTALRIDLAHRLRADRLRILDVLRLVQYAEAELEPAQ